MAHVTYLIRLWGPLPMGDGDIQWGFFFFFFSLSSRSPWQIKGGCWYLSLVSLIRCGYTLDKRGAGKTLMKSGVELTTSVSGQHCHENQPALVRIRFLIISRRWLLTEQKHISTLSIVWTQYQIMRPLIACVIITSEYFPVSCCGGDLLVCTNIRLFSDFLSCGHN